MDPINLTANITDASATNIIDHSTVRNLVANISDASATTSPDGGVRLVSAYDFLSDLTADVDITLDIAPHEILPMTGNKAQIVHKKDDGSVSVYTVSGQSYYDVEVHWTILTAAQAAFIFNLWHDQALANGMANTFYWEHPVDGHTYTVRFMSELKSAHHAGWGTKQSVEAVTLRIEGRKAD